MRTARIKATGRGYYHCISRVVDRRMVLGEEEKERFCRLMRAVEGFCGVRVLTYAVLSNHFHLLVEVSEREEVSDEEFLRRVGSLYGKRRVGEIERALRGHRAAGEEGSAEALKGRYTYRMCDVSEFMKTLKQRFTQWYNRRNDRKGTLWEERFKSVLVEGPGRGRGHALATMAAYIDLNPVRAGLAEDPKEYRHCGYAEAVSGGKKAREGLGRVIGTLEGPTGWAEASGLYRQILFEQGRETETRRGFSAERVRRVLEEGGELSRAELLRCRVRYFSDGVALGSRGFVEEVFEANRERFGAKRKTGARTMRGGDWAGLCTARDLRLQVIVPSGP